MASLSKCEILIGRSFSIASGLNGDANIEMLLLLSIFLVQAGDSACFTKHCSNTLLFLLCALDKISTTGTKE